MQACRCMGRLHVRFLPGLRPPLLPGYFHSRTTAPVQRPRRNKFESRYGSDGRERDGDFRPWGSEEAERKRVFISAHACCTVDVEQFAAGSSYVCTRGG